MSPNTKVVNGYNVTVYEDQFIYVIENLLDQEFCDYVIRLINTLPLENALDSKIECFVYYYTRLLHNANAKVYSFATNKSSNSLMYSNKLNGITMDDITQFTDRTHAYMRRIKEIMSSINNHIVFDYTSGYNLRKIYGETHLHSDGCLSYSNETSYRIDGEDVEDNDEEYIRNAAMVFALNDDFEGGEFQFPSQDIQIKMKKGSIIIFPPYYTHPHRVTKVEENKYRYTINTWALRPIDRACTFCGRYKLPGHDCNL
jgi:2OG-Fe(II) oxygenase superfamily